MNKWLGVAAVLLSLLPASARAQSDVAKKVLVVGWDGVRVDILQKADTPNLDRLIAEGTFSTNARTGPRTVSGPGWSSMLTGVWADKHGVHNNNFAGNDYATYPDFLTRLEQIDSSFATLAVVDWPPLGMVASGGPLLSDRIDTKINFDGDELGYAVADSASVAAAAEHLARENVDAAFVYLGNIDVVGHDTGSLSAAYEAAIEATDVLVGRLLDAVRNRAGFEQEDWLILMSTDHGRRDDGGHGQPSEQERTIFYLASGPSAARGEPQTAPSIVDVAVTALAHLGVRLAPEWRLDGRVVGLTTPP